MVMNERNIYDDIMSNDRRFASIPGYTKDEKGKIGMLRRQCTYEYKIYQVHSGIRILQGLRKRERFRPTAIWIGITLDEVQRVKPSQDNWARNIYPFVGLPYKSFFDKPWTRDDCIAFFKENNLPVPPKSSCVFCPYQSSKRWLSCLDNPIDKKIALDVDSNIRDSSRKGVHAKIYLTKHCLPLDQVQFEDNSTDLFDNECEGHCGL